ncbi:MAG: 5-formyltetrahydrofolate cyclo-ligase [Paracoccaceae bacterium]
MTDISARKSAARKSAFAVRAQAHGVYSGAVATRNLLQFLAQHPQGPISGYMPIRTEIDTLPALAVLSKTHTIAVPVVLGSGQPLEFHRWRPGCPMKAGAFGARIPVAAEPIVPKVVILPLLAFDARGYRLGYGGGFYDRTLEILRSRGLVLAVGFAYDAQEIDNVPTEATDQPLDAVVTERDIRCF